MKTIIKLFSFVMVLFTTMTFAQYHPDGCIPDPLRDKIKALTKDQINWDFDRPMNEQRIASFLTSFNDAFNRHLNGERVSQEMVQTIENIDEKYKILTIRLIAKSNNFETLKKNIETELLVSESPETKESLLATHYAVQLVEKSYSERTSALNWDCIANVIGFASTNVMSNPNDPVNDFGNASGGIAGGGCTPTFNPFPPRFCK